MTMKMVAVVVAVLLLAAAGMAEASKLKVGYYDKSCRGVENVVKYHVAKAIKADRGTGAELVRLIFHDCFVRVRRPLVRPSIHIYSLCRHSGPPASAAELS